MGTNNAIDPAGAAFAGGLLGATFGITMFIIIIFYILLIIAGWKIFEKAGEKGWKSIIPIYNIYILFKIVKMKSWFWWVIGMTVCAGIMFAVDGYNPYIMSEEQLNNYDYGAHPMTLVAGIVLCAVYTYTEIVYAWRTSKVFGHGIGYFLGLLLIPNIFWLILGFGSSKYDKKRLKK